MHIERKAGSNALPPVSDADSETTAAQDHASRFPMQLACARWTNGGDIPHVLTSERNMPMRAAWYAQAQANFQDWLQAGGFQQTEPAAGPSQGHGQPSVAAVRDMVHDQTTTLFQQLCLKTWPLPLEEG